MEKILCMVSILLLGSMLPAHQPYKTGMTGLAGVDGEVGSDKVILDPPSDAFRTRRLEYPSITMSFTHGRAVFQAGSLRESRPSVLYFYECPPPPEPLINSNELLEGERGIFRYFPNPVRDNLVIAWDAEQPGGTLTLTHISGTQVKRQEVRGNRLTMDMNDIPSGMYLLTWTPLAGQPVSEMLVLQH